MGLAALLRRDAADHVRAVRNSLLGVEGAGLAREALADDARVFVDPDLRAWCYWCVCLGSSSAVAEN